jgi:hypothetical protein
MTIKPEVLAAIERMCTPLDPSRLSGFTAYEDARCMDLIRAELLAMDAEIERLRKIEEERWSVVATRNAAVMRAEKGEYLLREAHPFVPITYSSTGQPQLHARIQSHLSELDAMHNSAREVGE